MVFHANAADGKSGLSILAAVMHRLMSAYCFHALTVCSEALSKAQRHIVEKDHMRYTVNHSQGHRIDLRIKRAETQDKRRQDDRETGGSYAERKPAGERKYRARFS